VNGFEELKFIDISREQDFIKYSDQISALTSRSKRDIYYLLYKNKYSYAFCIMDGDEIVGFQGFVYKPILIKKDVVPSFRSEFTIAKPKLRGSGIFAKFYKYTMDEIRRNYKEVYFWGETTHKGWIKFGFRMIKRYSFYQIFSKRIKQNIRKPEIFNRSIVNVLSVLFSVVNPFRFLLKGTIKVAERITYNQFKAFELNSTNFKLRLYMDEEAFKWRYIENDFHKYLFLTYEGSLMIIKENNSEVTLVDIYTKTVTQYLLLIAYLMRKYTTVIIHGNLYAFYKTPYFWLNLLVGFTPFLGGGSFVECNLNAKRLSWKDLPLLEGWGLGV